MKNHVQWFLALLPWVAGTVLGQDNTNAATSPLELMSQIPQCAVSCVTTAFLSSGCGLDNIAPCVCTNVTLLDSLSACVQSSCTWQDQLSLSYMTDDLCRPYPHPSRVTEIKLVVAVLAVITFPIVILRLVSRWIIASRLELDDWMTIVTAAILATTLGCVVATADLGFGLHYWNVNPENAQKILQLYYAVQMLYVVVLILAKLSIIALFARVFPDRNFQIINKLVFVFLVGHGLVFLFVIMFECTPIAGIWDRTLERKCVNVNAVAMASAILSIVEDIVIFAMPIQQLSRLQLGFKKKIAVGFMLSLGSFLPALRPLLKRIPGLLTTIRGTRPTVEVKETFNRASSRLSFGDKSLVTPAPVITSHNRSMSVPFPEPSPSEDSFTIKVHIAEHLDPRMKPLPPAPLQPLSYQPPWRDSATLRTPRTPMTPMSIRSIRREANAEYELDLRGVVNTKAWM
ncbi:integral membrane protein [Colletotrichum salicis]|uniref:Integral membrane protein n=1 Tax=Colletotrichum salicis TaxID=1209931 RepID=A0A135SI61_9PEZI|nr:integral membrane protein [Colletotrichum salicis]